MYMFKTLNEVRELMENWIQEYNEEGSMTHWATSPHGSTWPNMDRRKALIMRVTD